MGEGTGRTIREPERGGAVARATSVPVGTPNSHENKEEIRAAAMVTRIPGTVALIVLDNLVVGISGPQPEEDSMRWIF